jgi:hypothetical protein
MKKEFLPYNRSVKLKALGFDEPCLKFYATEKLVLGLDTDNGDTNSKLSQYNPLFISAPTYSQAFRWFREKYDLHGAVRKRNGNGNIYFEQIFDEDVLQNGPFDTYEEAELACLDKLIEIVETKQQE